MTTSAALAIGHLNHKHEGVMRWLLLNPDRTQGDCARELRYTEAWISRIINSDMFQAEYKRRCRETGVADAHSTRARISGLAATAMEKLQEKIELPTAEPRLLKETADMALKHLGYGTAPAPVETDTGRTIHVAGDLIVQARETARASRPPIEVRMELPAVGGAGHPVDSGGADRPVDGGYTIDSSGASDDALDTP